MRMSITKSLSGFRSMIDIPESVVMTWSKFDRFLFPSDNLDHSSLNREFILDLGVPEIMYTYELKKSGRGYHFQIRDSKEKFIYDLPHSDKSWADSKLIVLSGNWEFGDAPKDVWKRNNRTFYRILGWDNPNPSSTRLLRPHLDDVFAAPPSPPANEPDPLAPIIFEAEQEKKIEKKSAEPITVGYDKGYHKDFRDCKDGVPEPGPERVIQVLRPPLLESDADHDKEDLPNPTSPSQQKEMPGQPKVANVAGVKNEPVEIPVEAEACPPTADATETVVHMNEDLVTLASGVNDQDDIEDDSIVLIHRASLTWGGPLGQGRVERRWIRQTE
ncbi:hypothetical protein QJS10_CPB13g01122 [Acorus calamus]|uniref:Uncharacterized protein n=1 Tax=Acorus calamus TaxID=4465 RepID=A0AAV9DH60_ACOCL|nr:hypothetical protein QJS10_CPB13g01122 [Acorus calamus]